VIYNYCLFIISFPYLSNSQLQPLQVQPPHRNCLEFLGILTFGAFKPHFGQFIGFLLIPHLPELGHFFNIIAPTIVGTKETNSNFISKCSDNKAPFYLTQGVDVEFFVFDKIA